MPDLPLFCKYCNKTIELDQGVVNSLVRPMPEKRHSKVHCRYPSLGRNVSLINFWSNLHPASRYYKQSTKKHRDNDKHRILSLKLFSEAYAGTSSTNPLSWGPVYHGVRRHSYSMSIPRYLFYTSGVK